MKTIGEYTYCPTALTIHYEEYADLIIGKFCSIGHNVQIYLGGNHRTDWITQHPIHKIIDKDSFIEGYPATKGNVVIENDVWIGSDAVIMSGVTIKNGAVIGARSVVRRNINPYEVVIGNPMKVVRFRFKPSEIELLEKIKWWDWPIEAVKAAQPILQSKDVWKLEKFWKDTVMKLQP